MPYRVTRELVNEYVKLQANHRGETPFRLAKLMKTGSIIRVYREGSGEDLVNALRRLDLAKFANCKAQSDFDGFFFESLEQVAAAIRIKNVGNDNLGADPKWGHASKVLCIFLRDIVLYSRYFSDDIAKRLEAFLYMPVDSVVINRLRAYGVRIKPQRIKDISTREEFLDIQNLFVEAGKEANVPRIRFDDVWSENQ